MRIAMVTDTHGTNIMLEKIIERENPDAIIHCGDVWWLGSDPWPVPIHAIRGNHEDEYNWDGMTAASIKGYSNVTLHNDYTKFDLFGRRFGVLGRMDWEDTSKWAKENLWLGHPHNRAFARRPIDEVRELFADCDVLLFHDGPYPIEVGSYPNYDIVGSHYLADICGDKLTFHGHYHRRMVRGNIHGLAPADTNVGECGYAILTTTNMDVRHVNIDTEW